MKEWQIGILTGVLATISFSLLDFFFVLPYIIEMLIALTFTMTGTLLGNKWLNDRRKHKEQPGGKP